MVLQPKVVFTSNWSMISTDHHAMQCVRNENVMEVTIQCPIWGRVFIMCGLGMKSPPAGIKRKSQLLYQPCYGMISKYYFSFPSYNTGEWDKKEGKRKEIILLILWYCPSSSLRECRGHSMTGHLRSVEWGTHFNRILRAHAHLKRSCEMAVHTRVISQFEYLF